MQSTKLRKAIDQVRETMDEQGEILSRTDWKSLLEEIAADVEGHLDAIREEDDNDE